MFSKASLITADYSFSLPFISFISSMKDLTTGSEGKLIFYFAVPMLIGNIFQQLFNIIDSIIVGNFIGKEALAAVGASFPIIFILVSLIIGMVMGTTVVISQYFGAGELAKVKVAIDTMYIYTFFASIILSIVGLAFSEPLLRLLRLPEELIPPALQYMRIYIGGIILIFGYSGTSAALRGLGDSKTPLYFLIVAIILNIILVIVFVTVFKWGVAGAAFATVISNGVAFVLAVLYLNRTHKVFKLKINDIHFDKDVFLQSMRIGLPNGIQQTFLALGGLALIGLINGFGTDVIAGYTIASRLDSLATVPPMSFSSALSAFTGQNIGANKPERIKSGLASTMKMMTSVTIVMTLFIVLTSRQLLRLFTRENEVINYGAQFLMIVSPFYLILTLMFIYTGVMRGAGDSIVPMLISLASLWLIRIPLAYIISEKFGVTGIWWAIPAGWMVGLILSYSYYKTGRWKKKKVVKYIEEF